MEKKWYEDEKFKTNIVWYPAGDERLTVKNVMSGSAKNERENNDEKRE